MRTYFEIPALDLHFIMHQLNIKEGTRSVHQTPTNFKLKLNVQIEQEGHKLLDVGLSSFGL